MNVEALSEIIRRYYAAYPARDRAAVERLVSDELIFTSPDDVRIDRQTYFERCWPNSEQIRDIRIEELLVRGDEAIVRYALEKQTGECIGNVEWLRIEDEKIAGIEVYYGAAQVDRPDPGETSTRI
jgi:Domain of unknown function (DUF4440)